MTDSPPVRPCEGTLDATLEVPDDLPVSVAVTYAVADAAGTESMALPPLHDAVEPDALDAHFGRSPATAELTVRFRYAGYRVTVRGTDDGAVVTVFDCSSSDRGPRSVE